MYKGTWETFNLKATLHSYLSGDSFNLVVSGMLSITFYI